MALSRFSRNRKASSDVTILSGGRFLLAGAFIILVIFPFFGHRLLSFVGGSGTNANSIDHGFADLITKISSLGDGDVVPHTLSVDDGFYLVSFNLADNTNGKAIKPPDCNGIACLCVCTDPTCQKIDTSKNRGLDCKPLPDYQLIVASITGNEGGNQLYIKGLKTVSMKLHRVGTTGATLNIEQQ